MKTVILAGGFGTRISEESHLRPKPMVEIGEKPILWHIMKTYSCYGFYEFVICAGYKQHIIKEWFADYYLHNSDVTFDFTADNKMIVHNNVSEPWKVTIVDTGLNTMTGGRIKRIRPYVGDEPFFLTYGDAVADINIKKLLEFHQKHNKYLTLTTINISQQKGVLEMGEDGSILNFREKLKDDDVLVNGGYMVCNKEVFGYLKDDTTVFEKDPMQKLVEDGQVCGYYHEGFWQCMDTQREKEKLEQLWSSGNAPWKKW